MNKLEKIKNFEPNGVGELNNQLFGLPFTTEESDVVVIPVPWEVTVSFSDGTANGPQAILEASPQLDLYDPELENAWQYGISMLPIPADWKKKNENLRKKAKKYIEALENSTKPAPSILKEINLESEKLKNWIKETAKNYHEQGKKVCLLGGDHSTPLGLIEAISEKYKNFGILQIDAHLDLRVAYEGFEQSHASIMYNALQLKNLKSITHVGIRDYCEAELELTKKDKRINVFFDKDLKKQLYKGKSWDAVCTKIIDTLPKNVYISFDIDGLDPKLCPNTGTPVAGGFEVEEVFYLFQKLVESGKKIIGFDLVEVGNSEWDANVGARVLYRLANLMIKSQLKKSKS